MYQEKLRSISWGLAFGSIALLSYIATIVLSDSLTVLAELMKNVVLLLAVCMSWLALRRVAKGKDPYYNYGYGKVENLQSLVVAALMLAAIGIVIYEVIHRLQHPLHIEGAGLTIGIASAAFSVIAYLLLWRHDHHLAEKEASPVMESLWRLYRVKTISSLIVLASLALSLGFEHQTWGEYVDPAGSILLLGFLAYTAYGVVSMSVYDLLDRTLEESLQLTILRELAAHFHRYDNVHGIRSRRSGSNVYIEIFLEFDSEQKMGDVQKVINEMKASLEEKIPGSQVVIAPTTSPVAA